MNKTKLPAHVIYKNGMKMDKKMEMLCIAGEPRTFKIHSRYNTITWTLSTEFIGKNRQTAKTFMKNSDWNWENRQEEDQIEKILAKDPCLALYGKDRENMVPTDASQIAEQQCGKYKTNDQTEKKTDSAGSIFVDESERIYLIEKLECSRVGFRKFEFYYTVRNFDNTAQD